MQPGFKPVQATLDCIRSVRVRLQKPGDSGSVGYGMSLILAQGHRCRAVGGIVPDGQ
jgi:hypothetical protein